MCSIRCQLPNIRRNPGIVSSKRSHRARKSPWVHIGDQVLRLFTEWISLLSFVRDLQQQIPVRMILELLNQSFDCFFAICVLLLDCRMRYAGNSVINVTATGFPVLDALFAVMVGGFSRFGIKRILTSKLRICRKYDARQPWGLLCSINPFQSSGIPLSQYISQFVC